jgi:hypothetical protein
MAYITKSMFHQFQRTFSKATETGIILLLVIIKKSSIQTAATILLNQAVHRGAFFQFTFRWIYYCYSSKSTGKETGRTNLFAVVQILGKV